VIMAKDLAGTGVTVNALVPGGVTNTGMVPLEAGYDADAARFQAELRDRLARFTLTLHPDKTRLIQFGRRAAEERERAGLGKPETFNFLGFTHICGRSRRGRFLLFRRTRRNRKRAKVSALLEPDPNSKTTRAKARKLLISFGPSWHCRRAHQRHCGTGIWPGRDIAAGWRAMESLLRLC
jgi:hypothetical protein